MNKNWNGGLVDRKGVYKHAKSEQTLTVWVDDEQLVRYSVSSPSGELLVSSTERASSFSSWFLYFDDNEWVWFESGDIGCSVSKKLDDGSYTELPIVGEPELIRAMPKEFFAKLPISIQTRWEPIRDVGSEE